MANQAQQSADRAGQSSWRDADDLLDEVMAKLDRESRGVLVLRYARNPRNGRYIVLPVLEDHESVSP